MTAKRSMAYHRACRIAGLWLAAISGGIALSLMSVRGHVSADPTRHPQWVVAPSAQSTGVSDIRQEPIVEVEVDVRDANDVALLQSMGYSCDVGLCTLELRDGEEVALSQLGLPWRATARAVKVSASTVDSLERTGTALGEAYRHGENYAFIYIPDASPWGPGTAYASPIDITGAPAGATVTRFVYSGLIQHDRVADLEVFIFNYESGSMGNIWTRYGGTTDGGYDDDPEDDADICFSNRQTAFFNGDQVNQRWLFAAQDCVWWNTGAIIHWWIYVYYWVCDPPGVPSHPSPANGATQVSRDADLDWIDVPGASYYHVYSGPGPEDMDLLGSPTASQYTLGRHACSTRFYWQIGAVNSCAETRGAVWYFDTTTFPPAPSSPSPANHATGVSLDADLSWAASSPVTSYIVRWGPTNPPKGSSTTSTNHLALPPLSPNTKYYWDVTAVNVDCSTSGSLWDFTTGCVPATPFSPSPTDGATGLALDTDLDWADTPGATSYDVHFGSTPNPPLVGTTTSSNYALSTLTCATRYYWRIHAKSSCGYTKSPEWSFTTTCCLPGTPSGPSPATGSTNQPLSVGLDWADTAGATSYDVYFGTTSSPPFHGTALSSSYSLPPLTCGNRYYWKIVAKNSCGNTSGPVWTFDTVCCAPTAPCCPSPTDGATNQSVNVDLDWSETLWTASYDVYFGPSSPPPFVINTPDSHHCLPTLAYGTRYYWKIMAKSTCGTAASPEWSFTTEAQGCPMPGTPSGPSPAESASGVTIDADLDWGDAAGAASYDVYFGTSTSPPFHGNTTSSNYALPALAYNTRYYWKIVAKNTCGQTAGPVWDFTTQAAGSSPQVFLPIVRRP